MKLDERLDACRGEAKDPARVMQISACLPDCIPHGVVRWAARVGSFAAPGMRFGDITPPDRAPLEDDMV